MQYLMWILRISLKHLHQRVFVELIQISRFYHLILTKSQIGKVISKAMLRFQLIHIKAQLQYKVIKINFLELQDLLLCKRVLSMKMHKVMYMKILYH